MQKHKKSNYDRTNGSVAIPEKKPLVGLDYFCNEQGLTKSIYYRLLYEVKNNRDEMKTMSEWEKIYNNCK